ncbi:hypothetical protein JTB14_003673 [Gonioctena quinquepunctata]|nr:hypothetical protein JTB14_003673 [Gonioctena quinquepunctata]
MEECDYAREDYMKRKFMHNQLKSFRSTYPNAHLRNGLLLTNDSHNTSNSYEYLLGESTKNKRPENAHPSGETNLQVEKKDKKRKLPISPTYQLNPKCRLRSHNK